VGTPPWLQRDPPMRALGPKAPFPGAPHQTAMGSRSLREKEHLVNWNGIPTFFSSMILWMKVMAYTKLEALQFQH
jgi:hypothetical protein